MPESSKRKATDDTEGTLNGTPSKIQRINSDSVDIIRTCDKDSEDIDPNATLAMDDDFDPLASVKSTECQIAISCPVQLTKDELQMPLSRLQLIHRSAMVHEVVPVVYMENRRLKGAIWLLKTALAVERTRVKKLQDDLKLARGQ
ncbi:hypothetical protein BT96DRAFT_982705 [Gymnopus androsaceus JB14]|uniref:Uncharacterized protein n=1 Tax=Gymnopus androsaceus JB14 TaxID=1447944 RepID=A0A6A4GC45_9AGAR|nr:hypothetical protein BT96DRAFT_982705 [Gymnopus androsaceus JB14]